MDRFKQIASFILRKRVSIFKDKVTKIATDLIELIVIPKLVMMVFFMYGIYKAFFELNYDILKCHDALCKQSGYMARHMPVVCFIIWSNIITLENTIDSNEYFKPFYNCKSFHVGNSQSMRLLCRNLPLIVIAEFKVVFNNHFCQWLTDDAL